VAGIEIVFLDVGGPIYDDGVYADALLEALRDLRGDVDEAAFRREYDRCRSLQVGFTRSLAVRFGVDPDELGRAAAPHWRYPPEALYADVLPTLERLAARGRIGILANQPEATRSALERDGVAAYVDVWVISGETGFAKPDPRIFRHAVEAAGCSPERAVFVGNRLDYDVRPARAAGMRAIWLLRGEAPSRPTPVQLAEADAAIRSLDELPSVLERIAAAGR
jgi:HAD superfamily hydrolase (TIGR01509 family)